MIPATVTPSCNHVGDKFAWRHHRVQYPRCNRPADHVGPHRQYKANAEVLAEWIPSEVPTLSIPEGSDDLS